MNFCLSAPSQDFEIFCLKWVPKWGSTWGLKLGSKRESEWGESGPATSKNQMNRSGTDEHQVFSRISVKAILQKIGFLKI